MIDLGTIRPGSTIRIPFSTFDKDDGSSITMTNFLTADILVYKDGSTTERASTSGYTATTDFDSKTGKQLIVIDLADNTTSGFWSAGSEYLVAVDAVTVDAITTGGWVARFRIGYTSALLDTTIATLSSQTSFTLTVGPAEDDALNGMWAVIHDVASAVQCAKVLILDYTGSTKTVTLAAGGTFTAAAGDNFSVMDMAPLQPATIGRTLVVDSAGLADANTVKLGPTGSGTAQTARDLGASVLISSGTGTGQLSVTSGVISANVTQFGGSAGTFSGGRPEVNSTHWAGTAVGSATVRADVINIAGAAVSTSTAQLGVNVVNAGATAWNSGAITSSTFAAATGLRPARSNTAQAGAAGTITLDASASSTTDFYRGTRIYLTGGTGSGQSRIVTAYNGTTKVATITPNWATNPDNTTTFAITDGTGVDVQAFGGTVGTFSSGRPEVNTTHWAGTAVGSTEVRANVINIAGSAVNTSSAQLGVNVVNAAGTAWNSGAISAATLATDTITAAKIAADAIGASELAADAVAEIQSGLSTAAALATISGLVDDLETRLTATRAGYLDNLSAGAVALAATALSTAQWTNARAGYLDNINNTELATTVAQTGDSFARIGADGSALTAVPWNAAWDAEVQSEVQDVIEANNLDHLIKLAVDTDFATTVHLNSVVGQLADNGTTATFDRTTDSLEALRDRGDAAWVTGSSGGDWTSDEKTAIRSILGVPASGTTPDNPTVGILDTIRDTAAAVEVDTQDIQSRLPAALVSGRIDASVGAMAANTMTASALATDAVSEIQSGLATAANLATVAGYLDTEIAAILEDTGTTLPAQISALNNLSAAQVNTEVDTALADVGLTTTVTGRIDAAVSTRSSHTAADVWGVATRVLTAGTNIVLPANALSSITAWTVNITGNVSGSVGSVSGITFPTNFGVLGINSSGHVSRVTLADTLTTYTGNTPQTGDSYAIVSSGAHGNANLKTLIDAIDLVVDAIKVVTDKLTTTMELDDTVYRFTQNALEQAPTGAGGGASAADILNAFKAWVLSTGYTWEDLQKDSAAALGGNVTTNGTVYKLPGTATTRLTVVSDDSGNRTVTRS